jgi:hypothetical protein
MKGIPMARLAIVFSVALFLTVPEVRAAELRGTVLGADGKPAAGATVWAAATFVSPPLRVRAETDARGEFRLELAPLEEPQRWSICTRLGRQGGEVRTEHGTVKVTQEGKLAPVTIRLADRGMLRGRVLQAEDDQPIAGAKLFLDTGEVLQTDAQGRFAGGGLQLTEHSLIPVTPGRVRRYVLFDTSLRPDAELDIHLERGGKLTGRVLDEDGKPIAGAYVTRYGSGTALTLNGWDEVCDADGRFVYDGVALDRPFYRIHAAAPGFEPQELHYPAQREKQSAPDFSVRLKRQAPPAAADAPQNQGKPATAKLPRRDLAGIVYSPLRRPLAGARVRWGATQYEGTERETKTDEIGRFKLLDVPDRDGFVTVVAADYAPHFARVAPGQRDLEVVVEEGEVARGVVRDKKGKPLAGVWVVPVLPSPDPSLGNPLWLDDRQTHTDERGRFELRALPRTHVRFDFLLQGRSDLRNHTLKLGGEENVVEMSMGGGIRGRVVDPQGKPVRDFRIRLQGARALQPGQHGASYYAGYEWYGVSFTADDGTFVVSGMGAGGWMRVLAIAPGYGQAVAEQVQSQPLDELPPAERLTLRLTAPHALRVTVAAEQGEKPLAGAVITLIDDDPRLDRHFGWGYDNRLGLRRPTDKEGQVAFDKLEFGEATVLVELPGYGRRRFGWRQGEKEFRVRLAPEAIIKGTVKLAGRPLGELWARLTSADGDSYTAVVDGKNGGAFRFDQLPAGDYTLTVQDERKQLHQQVVKVKAGETREVPVELAAAGPKS